MRWLVEVTSLSNSERDSRQVEADTWQTALQTARAQRGESAPLSGFSIELLDEGCRAVDQASRLRYEVKRAAEDAVLPSRSGGTLPPPAFHPSRADVMGSTPSQIIFKREQEATETMPLTYREYVYLVPPGTGETSAEALLYTQLELVRTSLERTQPGKLVALAVFDAPFQGKPSVMPVATLVWKDWRDAAVVAFPRRPTAWAAPPVFAAPAPAPASVRPPPPPAQPEMPVPAASLTQTRLGTFAPAPVPVPVFAPPSAVPVFAPAPPRPSPAAPSPAFPAAPVPVFAPPFVQVPSVHPLAIPAPVPVAGATSAPVSAPAAAPPAPGLHASTPPNRAESVRPVARARDEDLIAELFEAMHDLHFARDALEGGDFCLAQAMTRLPCQAGIVHQYDIDRREFLVSSTRGPDTSKLLLHRCPEGDPMLSAATRKRRALVIADATQGAAATIARYAALGGARSIVVAPVMQSGRFLGAIELLNPTDGQPFTESEGNAVMYIAEQLAEFIATRGIVTDPERISLLKPPGV